MGVAISMDLLIPRHNNQSDNPNSWKQPFPFESQNSFSIIKIDRKTAIKICTKEKSQILGFKRFEGGFNNTEVC